MIALHPATLDRGRVWPAVVSRQNVILLLVLLLLLLSPFHMILKWFGGGRAAFTYWRELLVVFIVSATLVKMMWRQQRLTDHVSLTGNHLFFAACFATALIARSLAGVASGEDRYLAVGGLVIQLVYVPLALVVYSQLTSNAVALRFLWQVLIVLTIVSACAVFDWSIQLGRLFDDFGRSALHRLQLSDSYRAYLGADNPMELALYCGCGSVIAFGFLMLFARTRWEVLTALVAWAVCDVAVIGTMSRGPLAAIGLSHALIFVLSGHGRGAGHVARRGLYLVLLSVFGLTAIVGIKVAGLMPERLDFLVSSMADTQDESNSERIQRWAMGIDVFSQHPIAGQGLGNAETRFQEYQEERHGRSMECPESSLLTMSIEGGLFCTIPFMLLLLRTGYGAMQGVLSTSGSLRGIYVIYLAIFLAVCIEGLVCPLFTARSPNALFWASYGLFLAIELPRAQVATRSTALVDYSLTFPTHGSVTGVSLATLGGAKS